MKKVVTVPTILTFVLFIPLLGSTAQQPQSVQTKTDKPVITKLEQRIPPLMAEADIPGLAIAIIRNGSIAWSRGFGVKNADTKQPVDDNTVFEAASLTKPVFAYAVLKLVDSGKLDLDTPLTRYLPGRYDVGDDPRLDQITARRVLSHTTGFPNWRPRGDKTLKIYFTPGERFSYSGEGFVYLSRVVEEITGEKLGEFVKRTVLDPLGMTSSSMVWLDEYETRKTFAHNGVGSVTGRSNPPEANAAASLHTTATDYARFVCAVLRDANASSVATGADHLPAQTSATAIGLKPETARLMLTPQISVGEAANSLNNSNPKLSTTVSWGLGWGLEKTDAGMAFWHWGDNGNGKAFVVALEKQQTGVVMFANSASGLSIVREVVEEAMGGEHPSLAWINYESYDSPARLMFKAIIKSDAETVLAEYRKRRQMPPAAEAQGNGNSSNTDSPAKIEDPRPKTSNDASRKHPFLTEAQVNQLGYDLLSLKRVRDAIAVFKQNTVDFPEAFNTWDSLAEAYMINGDKELAIKYYRKSLELNPDNTNAVQKLKELEGE